MMTNNNSRFKLKSSSKQIVLSQPVSHHNCGCFEDNNFSEDNNLNHCEYKKRLIAIENKWNLEKENLIKNIHITIAKWGIKEKIYIRDLLKEISKIS